MTEQGTVEQLDGSYIGIRLCTCPELFERNPWIGSVDCVIDWHRTRYMQATWEADNEKRDTVRVNVHGNQQQRKAQRNRVEAAAMRNRSLAGID